MSIMSIILYIYIILYRYNMNERFNYIIIRLAFLSLFLSLPLEGQMHECLLTSINLSEFLYNSLNANCWI